MKTGKKMQFLFIYSLKMPIQAFSCIFQQISLQAFLRHKYIKALPLLIITLLR